MILEIIQLRYINLLFVAIALRISKYNKKHTTSSNYDYGVRCKDCYAELDIEDILFGCGCGYCGNVIVCNEVVF